jgi:glycerol kinase
MTKSSAFLEYIKLHLISLIQDMESHSNNETKIHLDGQIVATRHLLSVATDIMNSTSERV